MHWKDLALEQWGNDSIRNILSAYDWGFGEGNGTPLQYSCLENPMDGGAS